MKIFTKGLWQLCCCIFLLLATVGCSDPTAIGRYRAIPSVNVILNSLGVVDEASETYAGARDATARDLAPNPVDYVIGPGDFVLVSIFELQAPGLMFASQVMVSDTGRITLPKIGTLRAAGLTELAVVDEIENLLAPNIIVDPQVGVVVLNSVSKVFSIQGNVPLPGPYQLREHDLRISQAFAQAGGMPMANSDFAYVVRRLSEEDLEGINGGGYQAPSAPSVPSGPGSEQQELLESVTPVSKGTEQRGGGNGMSNAVVGMSNSAGAREQTAVLDILEQAEFRTLGDGLAEENALQVVPREEGWELVPGAGGSASWPEGFFEGPGQVAPAGPGGGVWGFDDSGAGSLGQEVIRVDLKKLAGGDPSQNIVIRPGDDIHVPANAIGVYFVTGQVARPGAYRLDPGQRLTLRQAMASGGPMTALAVPSRAELTRRLPGDREVTVRVDLQKVFEGTAPDWYLKPGDILNVGSHPVARWAAVIRQSFRATYGFGFVYDRNFADKDFGH